MTIKKPLHFTDNLIVDSHSDFQGYVQIPNQLDIKLILLLKCIFLNDIKEPNKLFVPLYVETIRRFVILHFKHFKLKQIFREKYIAYVCFLYCSKMSDRKDYNERSI